VATVDDVLKHSAHAKDRSKLRAAAIPDVPPPALFARLDAVNASAASSRLPPATFARSQPFSGLGGAPSRSCRSQWLRFWPRTCLHRDRPGSAVTTLEIHMLRVQQVMTQNVHCCDRDDSLERAAQLMWEHDIGAVIVIDGAGRPIAMLTDRDMAMAAYIQGKPLAKIRVAEAMSKSLVTAQAFDSVSDVEQVMREHQVRRVPVVDARGELAGIVSQNDLVREAARERESSNKELSAVEVTATLAAISQPRFGRLGAALA
jgi:CBS domain-containing protein